LNATKALTKGAGNIVMYRCTLRRPFKGKEYLDTMRVM